MSFDDAHKLLSAFMTSIGLKSIVVNIRVGTYAIHEPGFPHAIPVTPTVSASSWGHYGNTLENDTLLFACRRMPRRSAHFSSSHSFNRVS